MRRGDIWLADLGEPVGHESAFARPVLLLSAQPWLDSHPPVVTVLPLSRARREAVTHVEVEPGRSGLRETSYVRCEDVRALSPRRLERRFGAVDEVVLRRVETLMRRLLAL